MCEEEYNQSLYDFVARLASYDDWEDVCRQRYEEQQPDVPFEDFMDAEQMSLDDYVANDELLMALISLARDLINR